MDILEGLLYGLTVAITPQNLLAAAIGAVAGSLVGVIPGLGSVTGAAILLPITFAMDPTAGVIMIAAIYYGAMYGSSTTGILLNIPGEVAAAPATFEGYPMAQRGRAGAALGIVAIASLVGGVGAIMLTTVFSQPLARVALVFGPAEFFALTAGGLLVLSRVMEGRLVSSLIPLLIGTALGTIGRDPVSGSPRYTFGVLELNLGVELVVVAVGVFGLAELMSLAGNTNKHPKIESLRLKDLIPTKKEIKRSAAPWGRGGALGFLLGLLPGPSGVMSAFLAYRVEKSVSKKKEEFGHGAVEGLAGPEAANNAAATSSIIPVLVLGLPFSATLALIFAALQSHGITPGPLIIEQHPEIFWGVIASMFIANAMLFFLNFNLIRVWVALLRIPPAYLVPAVMILCVYASFVNRQSVLDVAIAFGLGLLGFAMRRLDFHVAPLLLGILFAPLIERNLVEALILGQGDAQVLLSSPVSIGIWVVVLLVMCLPLVGRLLPSKRKPLSLTRP